MALLLVLAACGREQRRDVEGVPAKDPDKIELYLNIDQYPNVVRLCIGGVAFATTTRDFTALVRVPEWDRTWCAA